MPSEPSKCANSHHTHISTGVEMLCKYGLEAFTRKGQFHKRPYDRAVGVLNSCPHQGVHRGQHSFRLIEHEREFSPKTRIAAREKFSKARATPTEHAQLFHRAFYLRQAVIFGEFRLKQRYFAGLDTDNASSVRGASTRAVENFMRAVENLDGKERK
jgi:hypothetical protein